MMKQPPYVTKLRLSKLCRGIIALAVVKLCLLVAIVADIPLPELRWEKVNATQNSKVDSEAAALEATPAEGKSQSTTLVMGNPGRSLLAASASNPSPAESAAPASASTAASAPTSGPAPAADSAQAQAEPQGAAAAAAAARMRPLNLPGAQDQPTGASVTMPVSPLTRENAADIPAPPKPDSKPALQFDAPEALTAAAPASTASATPASASAASASPAMPEATPLPSSGPALLLASDTTKASAPSAPAAGENPWWKNMLHLTHLPVPSMGVAQVAHAAALDTPPAPAVQGNTGGSPFTPPAQQVIPKGQDASGAPLPPRASTARPAGTPQLPRPTGADNADPMTSAVQPPAPNVGAYTPPEDPNRKQQELARREQEILALKQQMEQRLEELRTAEMRVKGMLKDAKDVESQKVSGLIAVYANMKPKQAAQTLQSLDERVAVKILTGLTPKQAGEILSYADPKTTAKLTELMTRMHMQP